jgi:hypothetical protein
VIDVTKYFYDKSFRSTSSILFISVVFIVCAMAYGVLYQLDYKDHFLNGDEIADVITSVNDGWTRWFTHGFSENFNIYEEWFSPVSNLLKPVMSAEFFALHAAFGERYDLYFMVFFAEIIVATLMMRDAAIDTGSTPRAAAIVSLVFMLNPSIVLDGLVNVAFQNDFLAGFFVLAAFCTLLRKWYAATLALTLLACFTKEIAWPASIAACVSWAVLYRDRVRAIGLLAPLPMMFALRYMAFGALFSGVDIGHPGWQDAGLLANATQIVRGMMLWPLGTVDFKPISEAALGHPGLSALVQVVSVGINAVFWCAMAFFATKFRCPVWITLANAVTGRNRAGEFNPAAKRRLAVFVFLLGTLAFSVLLAQQERYGAILYAFLLMAAGPLIESGPLTEKGLRPESTAGRGSRTWIAPAARLGLAGVLFAFVYHGAR